MQAHACGNHPLREKNMTANDAQPMSQKQVDALGHGFNDTAVMQALHRLADYPVLADLAATRTQATSLDGRACRYLYEAAGSALAQYEVSENERAFMQQIGVVMPTDAHEAEGDSTRLRGSLEPKLRMARAQ